MKSPRQRSHRVVWYGRLFYWVSSASRKNKWHLCDLEVDEYGQPVCDCESFRLRRDRPCRHIFAIIAYIVRGAKAPKPIRDLLRATLIARFSKPAPPETEILPIAQDIDLTKPTRCVIDESPKRRYQLRK